MHLNDGVLNEEAVARVRSEAGERCARWAVTLRTGGVQAEKWGKSKGARELPALTAYTEK